MKNILSKINHLLLLSIIFCNILYSKNSDFNIINLIGEAHDDPECIKLQNKLAQKANNGKIILALEGQYLENFNSNTFGIEDKNAYNLVKVWFIYSNMALLKIANSIASIDPIYSDSLKKRSNEYMSPPSRKLSEIIDTLLYQNLTLSTIATNKDNKQILQKLFNLNQFLAFSPDAEQKIADIVSNHSTKHPFFLNIHPNLSHWIELYKCIVNLYLNEIINKNQEENIDILRTLIINHQKINEYATIYADQLTTIDKTFVSAIIDTMLINFYNSEMSIVDSKADLRDRFFLKNIIHVFENQKFQEKPFYAIVGADHIPYLYKELIKKGYQVELNNRGQEAYTRYISESLNDGKYKHADKNEL